MSLPPLKILAVDQQHCHKGEDTVVDDEIPSPSNNSDPTTHFATTSTRRDDVTPPFPSSSIANPEQERKTVAVGLGELSEDVLSQIFDIGNGIFSVKDLLNFRFVNRRWRDVATSVLLVRNLCEISLCLGEVKLDQNAVPVPNAELQDVGKTDETEPHTNNRLTQYKYFHSHRRNFLLSDLNELISTSQKPPFSNIRFEAGCHKGFGKLCPSCDCEPHQEDLMQFFALYGGNIKKLTLCNYVTKGAVQNLLYTYLPNVTILNLRYFKKFTARDCLNPNQDIFYFSPFHASFKASKFLKIQEIRLSTDVSFEKDKKRLLKQIIKVSPKLRVLNNVNLRQLKYLRKIGRERLIQSVCYDPSVQEMWLVKEIVDFLPNNFNAGLTNVKELSVKFTWLCRNFYHYSQAAIAVNGILEACKDSIELLEFHVYAERVFADIVKIPLLSKLKYLRLVEDPQVYSTQTGSTLRMGNAPIQRIGIFGIDFLSDLLGCQQHHIAYKEQTFPGQKMSQILQFGVDSMPNLERVEIVLQDDNEGESYDKVLAHLTLQNFGEELLAYDPEGAFLTVTVLELSRFCEREGYLPKLFPNVRDLKIMCKSTNMLQNWVWGAFGKLEKFEIEGLCGTMDSNIAKVDNFFTGLQIISETDRDKDLCLKDMEQGDSQNLDVLGIWQCRNLKEFKITFGTKLTSVFASRLTSAIGFQLIVPQTKIIFSFQAVTMCLEEIKEMTETHLAPILPYIEIWK